MSGDRLELKIIARIRTDFPTKFGIPRQSGLCDFLKSQIVFEREYRNADSLRGLEGFSHLWLIWEFSENVRGDFSPTVRPPRLGGNERVGVFATRSPFRPNPLGLSCVKLEGIERTPDNGTVLLVSGADLMDGTPIYDIKPYLPYTDSRPDAVGGFADRFAAYALEVDFPEELKKGLSTEKVNALTQVLASDPRPSYQNDDERIYGFPFAGFEVRFTVDCNRILHVVSLCEIGYSAVIAGGLSYEAKEKLCELGVELFEPDFSDLLPEPTALHADMLCHILPDGSIVLANGQEELAKKLCRAGFTVNPQRAEVSEVYPSDCALNCVCTGSLVLCKRAALSPILAAIYTEGAYNIIDVRQGYAKCGTAIIGEKAIITENRDIFEKASTAGIDALLINVGEVALPGYSYGFIGGAAGLITPSLLAFNGDISAHSQYKEISSFLKRHGVGFVCLTREKLTDCGGILKIR